MPFTPLIWRLRTRTLSTEGHSLIMGVVNVTPDSFSDGGRFWDTDAAVAHGVALTEAGADLIDIGGESTRPGADPVGADEELQRVLPVVTKLAGEGIAVSVDTSKADVAAAAIEAGAEVVNDVSALRATGMAQVCVAMEVGVVLMHMQGTPQTMDVDPQYEDVVAEVGDFLVDRAQFAEREGIDPARVAIDPGVGFGKDAAHNMALLGNLDVLVATGYPVLVGSSRKRFISDVMDAAGFARSLVDRDVATAATVATSIMQGAAIVRVHDVATAAQVGRMADAIVRASH